MSYLDSPRLHFTGFFQADVSTVNNDVRYYSNPTFQDRYQQMSPPAPAPSGGWNPEGTGAFRFVGCRVTGASLHYRAITSGDPVIGMTVENADRQVSGKLVDLDPQQQMVSQIWGLQVRLTDGAQKAFFLGDFVRVAFTALWQRQQSGVRLDQKLGAVYQSVLRNVEWKGHAASPVLEALARASADGWLAIDFNLYGYGRDPAIPRYTLGRVAGTIGPYVAGEPKHFVMGRHMEAAMADGNPTAPAQGVYGFQCKAHEPAGRLTADFGNCLQIVNADGAFVDHGTLTMAVLKTDTDRLLATVTADQVALLGRVDYQQANWYPRTAGVQDFDYSGDAWLQANIATHPLVLLGPASGGRYPVLVQESLGGLYVRADNFVCRLDPGERVTVDLFASRWGRPLSSAEIVTSVNNGAMGGSGAGSQPLTPPVGIPDIATPPDAIAYPARVATVPDGHAPLTVDASPNGPGNPRVYIDGQLYGIGYRLAQRPAQSLDNFWNFISVLAFDLTPVPHRPTWLEDIQPILRQYGNLYPIMSKHLVDLGDYDSVVKHLSILQLAFSLPEDDPNHMPVTRDLSGNKRAMILKWMATPGAEGLPLKGDVSLAAPAMVAPAGTEAPAVPLEPGQIASKTAVLLLYEAREKARKESAS